MMNERYPEKKIKCEIFRDSMQNYKKYAIPPAQLVIADVPYNVGTNNNYLFQFKVVAK